MSTPGVSQPTTPGSNSHGFAWKSVIIQSIDGNTAVVTDQLTKTFNISITNMPAKGVAPLVGEQWIVHRMFGPWAFGLCLNTPTSLLEGDISNLPEDLAAQENAFQKAAFGQAGRSAYPYVVAALSADLSVTGSSYTFATSGWASILDTDTMFTATTGSTPCFFTVPFTGRYNVRARLAWPVTSTAGQTAAKILLNGTVINTNTIGADIHPTTAVLDGSFNAVNEDFLLSAGDKVYMVFWTQNTLTLKANITNVGTRFSMRYIGNT